MVDKTLLSTNINNIKTLRVEIIIILSTLVAPFDKASNCNNKQENDETFTHERTVCVVHQRMLLTGHINQ
jgi:hypothetical protein